MSKPLRIFISSPGDVSQERRRAALVIESLKKEFARFFEISAYLWEHEAMLATGHFQDVIEPPSQSDIVVLILWSRLGTPLPEKSAKREYRGLDGRTPVTGTEWEYEDALAANKAKGAPDLLVYRSNQEPQISLRDPTKKQLAENQWGALEAFWSRYFQAGGVFLSAYHSFDGLEDFGDMLEAHLRQLIRARIEKLRLEAGESKATWTQSPFRGLSAFDFEHAPIFFGRGAAQLRCVEQIVKNAASGAAFLLVLGASGSGKSSLVRAGVLPNLFARGVADGVGQWRRATFKPGDAHGDLFLGLAKALSEDGAKRGVGLPELIGPGVDHQSLANALRKAIDDPGFIIGSALGRVTSDARATNTILPHETVKLALVLDQLEEIFTDSSISTEDRNAFIRLIRSLTRQGQVWVIATMRSDFWHRAAAAPELVAMADGPGRIDLLPPSMAELAEMIRRPAAAAGLSFEDHSETKIGLDAVIAEEASHDPGALPLVSFVLEALYQTDIASARGAVLSYDTYESLGGLKGAIASRADELLGKQPETVQAALPSLLRALVTVGADRGQSATARVAPLSAFPKGTPRRQLADVFLDPAARLLVADGDGAEARIRVAHEALITHWAKAKEQINRDRRDLETRTRLEGDEAVWRAAPQDQKSARLLEGLSLEEGKDLVRKFGEELPEGLKDYVVASEREASRKRNRRMRVLGVVAAVMALLAVGAGVLGIYAQRQSVIAQEQEARAVGLLQTSRVRAAELFQRSAYIAANDNLPDLSLALALESVRIGRETGELPSASLAALQQAASNDRAISYIGYLNASFNAVAFGSTPGLIYTATSANQLVLWESLTGRTKRFFGNKTSGFVTGAADAEGNRLLVAYDDKAIESYLPDFNLAGDAIYLDDMPSSLAVTLDGRIAVAGDDSGNVYFIDPQTSTLLGKENGHASRVNSIAIADQGTIAVTVGQDGIAVVWDLTIYKPTGMRVRHYREGLDDPINGVAISPRGDQFATISGGFALVYSPTTGEILKSLSPAKAYVYDVKFLPGGESLVYTAGSTLVRLSTADFSEQMTYRGHSFDVRSLSLSEDGARMLSASGDNTLRLWDVQSGALIRVFRSGKGTSIGIDGGIAGGQALSRDGNFVTAVLDDGTLGVWSVTGVAPTRSTVVHDWNINAVKFSPDGTLILTASSDGKAMVTDAATRTPLFSLCPLSASGDCNESSGQIYNGIFSMDGVSILTSGQDGAIVEWDSQTGARKRTVRQMDEGYYPYWIELADGGKKILAASWAGVEVIDAASGNLVRKLSTPDIAIYAVAASPDGKVIAAGASDGRIYLWSLENFQSLGLITEHRAQINTLAFSPDSKSLLSSSSDGTARLFDVASLEPTRVFSSHTGLVLSAAFSPDGKRLITTSFDATVKIWDAETGAVLGNYLGAGSPFRSAHLSPDMKTMAAVGDDRRLNLWDMEEKVYANTPTGFPVLADELKADGGKRLNEFLAWAPMALRRPMSSGERADYSIDAAAQDADARVFPATANACDRLAAWQSDPGRTQAGVREGWVPAEEAVLACQDALKSEPDNQRLRLQLARSLMAQDKRVEALKEAETAANAGYPGAIYYLGFYLADAGIEENTNDDLTRGVAFVEKAWAAGVVDAGEYLGLIHKLGLKAEDGTEIVKIDRPKGFQILREAADKGSWFASLSLAESYQSGDEPELKQDRLEALYYLGLAVRQIEVDGLAESTESKRAAAVYANRATLTRDLVRDGKGAEVAEVARRIAGWRPLWARTASAAN